MVNFESVEDYRHVLFEGLWMVADHYMLIQWWRLNFLKSARVQSRVAIWIRVPELPLELYNDIFFKRLGATLGTLLKVDKLTSIHSRGQFARICVEVDLAKPLVPQVEVRGELINLEYKGLHSVCFNCGVYGHRASACKNPTPSTVVPTRQPEEEASKGMAVAKIQSIESTAGNQEVVILALKENPTFEESTDMRKVDNEDTGNQVTYGPWMLSKKQAKGKAKVGQQKQASQWRDRPHEQVG